MELRLRGYGATEIIDAARVDGDDILIKSKDNFRQIEENAGCEITKVYLVELDFKWSLVAWKNTPDDVWGEDESVVVDIENQDDVYELNALL